MNKQFIYPLKIQIEDTDFSGLVYHANYLNFLERARSEWIEQLGFGVDWQRKEKLYLLVHSCQLQFIKPATLHDQVEVVSTLTALRHASMIFEQYLRLAATPDKILFKAELKIACVNHQIQPHPLPESLTEKIRRTLT